MTKITVEFVNVHNSDVVASHAVELPHDPGAGVRVRFEPGDAVVLLSRESDRRLNVDAFAVQQAVVRTTNAKY